MLLAIVLAAAVFFAASWGYLKLFMLPSTLPVLRAPTLAFVFAVLLISASYLIGELTAGQDVKIIKDLGLASISLFGLLIAIFIGIGLVWKEVEKRSIYTLLPKPMRRQEFLLGKYCGLALTLVINVAVMTLAFYAVLAYMQAETPDNIRASWPAPATDPAMLKAVAPIVLELLLVTAIALFFSTFSSPFLSAMMTMAVWVIGHFNQDLRDYGAERASKRARQRQGEHWRHH